MTDSWERPTGTGSAQTYPCGGCGARVQFAPGTTAMRCPYCGFQQQIAPDNRQVRKIPYADLPMVPRQPVASLAPYVYSCQGCGGQTQTTEIACLCQFCKAPLVTDAGMTGQIGPEAVLPFTIDRTGLRTALRKWVSSRWFAPSALKKVSEFETTKGSYVPHWAYDSQTFSQYVGQRGEHYYETEHYTDSSGNRQSRQVRRTRWYPVNGVVSRNFQDVLVPGSLVLPPPRQDELAPWPMADAVPYQPQYLAGYHAQRYDVEPETGFEEARSRMAKVIEGDCRADIGGDEQRVESVDTTHHNVALMLVLLPLWLATYSYLGKRYQIVVNGRTGEVHGERPYSKVKIALAILVALVVVGVAIYLFAHSGHHTSSGTSTIRHH